MQLKAHEREALRVALREKIEQHGFVVVACEATPKRSAMAYTIGLWSSRGWPELIVLDMPADQAEQVIKACVAQWKRGTQAHVVASDQSPSESPWSVETRGERRLSTPSPTVLPSKDTHLLNDWVAQQLQGWTLPAGWVGQAAGAQQVLLPQAMSEWCAGDAQKNALWIEVDAWASFEAWGAKEQDGFLGEKKEHFLPIQERMKDRFNAPSRGAKPYPPPALTPWSRIETLSGSQSSTAPSSVWNWRENRAWESSSKDDRASLQNTASNNASDHIPVSSKHMRQQQEARASAEPGQSLEIGQFIENKALDKPGPIDKPPLSLPVSSVSPSSDTEPQSLVYAMKHRSVWATGTPRRINATDGGAQQYQFLLSNLSQAQPSASVRPKRAKTQTSAWSLTIPGVRIRSYPKKRTQRQKRA